MIRAYAWALIRFFLENGIDSYEKSLECFDNLDADNPLYTAASLYYVVVKGLIPMPMDHPAYGYLGWKLKLDIQALGLEVTDDPDIPRCWLP